MNQGVNDEDLSAAMRGRAGAVGVCRQCGRQRACRERRQSRFQQHDGLSHLGNAGLAICTPADAALDAQCDPALAQRRYAPKRTGAPTAAARPAVQQPNVPPPVPEASMVSMLLVGLGLLALSMHGEKQEKFDG